MLFGLPILQFAIEGPSGAKALPGYVSLFAHTEQGGPKRKGQIGELYDQLRPSLMAYLSGLGLYVDEAEDVIQESFLRLVRHRAGEREEENLRGWLFRVAHNLTMDRLRLGNRFVPGGIDHNAPDSPMLQIADTSLSPEEIAIRREELRRVWAAMGRLTAQQRQAVLLRAEGLRYREIATVLELSTQRVAELVQRALARLAGDV